jgi:hypothetical protein
VNDRLWAAINGCEPQTGAALVNAGYAVKTYGQALLTPEAREMLRGEKVPELYTPDFIVSRAEVTDRPRWPRPIQPKHAFYVDAKWAGPTTSNHSIEMRSIVAAPTFGLEVYYVCSHRHNDEYQDFRVIYHAQVLRGRHRPCCAQCYQVLTTSKDPMHQLPDYCPAQPRNSKGSRTPFVVVANLEMHPLRPDVFDTIRPDFWEKVRPS